MGLKKKSGFQFMPSSADQEWLASWHLCYLCPSKSSGICGSYYKVIMEHWNLKQRRENNIDNHTTRHGRENLVASKICRRIVKRRHYEKVPEKGWIIQTFSSKSIVVTQATLIEIKFSMKHQRITTTFYVQRYDRNSFVRDSNLHKLMNLTDETG